MVLAMKEKLLNLTKIENGEKRYKKAKNNMKN